MTRWLGIIGSNHLRSGGQETKGRIGEKRRQSRGPCECYRRLCWGILDLGLGGVSNGPEKKKKEDRSFEGTTKD